MKFIVTIVCICLIHSYSFSQIVGFEKKDTTQPFLIFKNKLFEKVNFGFEYNYIYAAFLNTTTYKKNRGMVNSFEPHLSYYPKKYKNLGFGITGRIEFFKTNVDLINKVRNVYELGMFARYFIPFQFNVKVFNRLSFSALFSFSKTNYSRRDKDIYYFGTDSTYTMYNGLQQNLIRFGLTWQFRFYKGLNFKMSYRYEMYLNKFYKYRPTFGLEYHFYYEEKKKEKKDL
jgi:hypothetical protein